MSILGTITIPPIPYDLGQIRPVTAGPYAGKVATLKADDGYWGIAFYCEFSDGTAADWVAVVELGNLIGQPCVGG